MGPASPTGLARDALGIGLRPVHYHELFERRPAIDYLEIISENFLGPAARARRNLDRARERYPIVLHGVGLNLLGHAPLDERYLDRIAALAELVDAPFVTDHLCWTGARGLHHHDLLPTPYTPALVELAGARAAYVQARLGRPFGLENLSSYVEFRESTLREWEFYSRVVERADCWYMLDVNNVYVSSVNHGFSAHEYVDAIDFDRVLQVHLAGHSRATEGTIVDTHDAPVADEVWRLYAHAWRRGGPFPTLIEWDAAIPPLSTLLAELDRAREVRA
ncbi:DUF692 domain-containing protein [Nannocystaceae bacterium ST9]